MLNKITKGEKNTNKTRPTTKPYNITSVYYKPNKVMNERNEYRLHAVYEFIHVQLYKSDK